MFSPCTELRIFMYWTCNSMNNLSSYCGLVDAKIRASDKDLPVRTGHSKYEKVFNASPFDEFILLEICAGRRFARRTGSRFADIFFSSNHNVNLPMPWRWVCHRARMRWYARAIPDMRKSPTCASPFDEFYLLKNACKSTSGAACKPSSGAYLFFVKSQCELTDAMAMSLPSCENEMVRTGHSRYEKVLTQANSLTSHNETNASALPTAKYLPVGSNSIQMQFAGCACNTKSRKIDVSIKIS